MATDTDWAATIQRERDDLKSENGRLRKLALDSGMQGHNQLCYYCKEMCSSVAGDPSRWPVPLTHREEPGVVKWHHVGCVSMRLQELIEIKKNIVCNTKETDNPEILTMEVTLELVNQFREELGLDAIDGRCDFIEPVYKLQCCLYRGHSKGHMASIDEVIAATKDKE